MLPRSPRTQRSPSGETGAPASPASGLGCTSGQAFRRAVARSRTARLCATRQSRALVSLAASDSRRIIAVMPIDVPVSCTCGAVAGLVRGVTPENSRRLSCMCDDCQVYAQYLGRAEEMLDRYGGTDLSYATQSRVEIVAGRDRLLGIRLYPTGILRVYTACCRTPVAHVPSAKMAFVGIPHLFMREGPGGTTRDAVLGPLTLRLQGRYCRGEMPRGAHSGTPAGATAAAMMQVVWDSLRGRQRPSAFHEALSNAPAVPVTVLSADDLQRLRGPSQASAPLPTQSGVPQGCS